MAAPNKKPTMMEMKNAVTNVIQHVDTLYKYVQSLDLTLTEFIKYKGDGISFDKHCKDLIKKNKVKEDKE